MTNIVAVYTCIPLLFITVVILIIAYVAKKEEPTAKLYMTLCGIVIFWHTFQLLYISSSNIKASEIFYTLQMIVIPFSTVALLAFVLKFCKYDKFINKKYFIPLCIVPAITVIMALTNNYHHLFRTEFAVITAHPFHELHNIRGPWYWFHTAYSYSLSVLCIITLVNKIRATSRFFRLPLYLACLGVLSALLFNITDIMLLQGNPTDSTLAGLTFGLMFIYFGIDTSSSSSYIIARTAVFEALDEYIFVLNMTNIITDVNIPARKWLEKYNVVPDAMSFDQLLDKLVECGALIDKSDHDSDTIEIFFPEEKSTMFTSFQLKKQYIYNKQNLPIGIIMTFSDITHMRNILSTLQEASSIDTLTGIYNRRIYDKTLVEYDNEAFLPLSVIIGDVNGLKYVNDNMGHAYGDSLLRSIAETMISCVQSNGVVTRIGGDEFAIICAEKTTEEVEQIIASIRATIRDRSEMLYGCTIALGYGIKTNMGQDIKHIIDEADKQMYMDKANDRRSRRN